MTKVGTPAARWIVMAVVGVALVTGCTSARGSGGLSLADLHAQPLAKYAGSALRGECPTLPVTEGLVFRSCFTQSGDKSNNRVFLEPGRYAVVLLCESGGQATYAAKGLPGTAAVTAVCGKDNIGLAGFFTSDQEQEVIVEVSYEGSGEGVGQLVKLP